ncbi:membrane protein [Paramagnetospirillum magneticum]|uniref:Glutamine amidotransferase domain-containing protein n=1 Tax=Paramagnetospirillum magneticum (strain ATCC 700264 / AMB-1) TaxID=342108 RepID=Q2W0F5_PARM1|nr:membrane protein [Paramagnetospirillum magneticum]BAE52670.1 hypothetical protein amb3866 [Paramagnetospirillum magneticum AMB-1]
MSFHALAFAPLFPWPLIAALGGMAVLLVGVGLWRRASGTLLRAVVMAVLLAALANPRLLAENRTTLPDVALVVVDETPSQGIGERRAQTREALDELTRRLALLKGLEVRVERVGAEPGADRGTRLFEAAERALADVPRRRLAGVTLITDGRVHDVPADLGRSLGAPVHTLLTGAPDERDRRLVPGASPAFALVGETATLAFRVEDQGGKGDAVVAVRLDGKPHAAISVPLNRDATLDVPIRHAGANVVELEVEPGPGELSLANNRTALSISGVRNRLKVLLVSGEPHAGERTWRNLLKSDPAVDLVHFTILRPPEKDDQTPIREMSLISFPVRELFEEKLAEFDLIIFDRYRRRGVLAPAYYRNLARYVRDGGALLAAVGPEFAEADGIAESALAEVLPALPTGRRLDKEFRPRLTEAGRRHPVMAGLPGTRPGDAPWGSWMRQMEVGTAKGTTLLSGLDDRPLVVLDRVGEGRVAMVLSDTLWLWARGWEGGGPHAEMTRRLAHWLMKEPDLEENALTAAVEGGRLMVAARGAPDGVAATITAPDGTQAPLRLDPDDEGVARGALDAGQTGLWRVSLPDGRVALAAAGQAAPVELAELTATPERLFPVAKATGGIVSWLSRDGLPDPRRVAAGSTTGGRGWMGLAERGDYVVDGIRETALAPALALALLCLGGLLMVWRNETR